MVESPSLLDRAIKAINNDAESLAEFHLFQIVRRGSPESDQEGRLSITRWLQKTLPTRRLAHPHTRTRGHSSETV